MRQLLTLLIVSATVHLNARLAAGKEPDCTCHCEAVEAGEETPESGRMLAIISENRIRVVSLKKVFNDLDDLVDVPSGTSLLFCDELSLPGSDQPAEGVTLEAQGDVWLRIGGCVARGERVSIRGDVISLEGNTAAVWQPAPDDQPPRFTLKARRIVFDRATSQLNVSDATVVGALDESR